MAAKGKYREWLTEEGLTLITGWARDGLTEKQISHNMGIGVSTLAEWKNRFPELLEALKNGKEVADYQVENALFEAAIGGNITAMIFWLKNRRPDKWRDKPEPERSGEEDGTGVILLAPVLPIEEPPEEGEDE